MNIKHAVRAALVIGGMVAATAAQAAIDLPSTGNGSLVLFVLNSTNNTVYARDLGPNVDDIITQGTGAGSTGDPALGTTPGVFSLNYSLNVAADGVLDGFLNDNDTFTWAVLGSDTVGGTSFSAPRRFAFTSPIELNSSNTPLNSGLATLGTSQNTFWNQVSATLGSQTSFVAPLGAAGGAIDYALLNNFFNQLPGDATNGLGTTQNFYLLTNSTGGNPTQARTFVLNDLELTTDGNLVAHGGVSEVPLPAAVWLLGSGLMGLAGIGRRRRNGVQAAA